MTFQRITNRIEQRSAPLPARIRVIHGPDAGLEIPLPQVGAVLGAATTCDLVLHDPAVSGRHVTVVAVPNGLDVADLGSRNGTWLDGVALTRATVPLGTTLRVGASLVQFLPADAALDLPPSEASSFGELLGESAAMRVVYAVLERTSRSPAPILFLGESGTGKELAARAVHAHSPRASGPFVVFDCGAVSDTLIESDLFGHVRGAFTGAHADRQGAFASADGGTLFLDEIGDLPLPLQPKLLRLLETGEATPLGGRRGARHDVRVVAATHRDLPSEVARGTFRGDLYYRLAVVEVLLPSLRQRLTDIPTLVRAFLRANGRPDEPAGPNLHRLLAYRWPGNVRELRNVIARAVALAPPDAPFAELPILLGTALGRAGEVPSNATAANSATQEVAVRADRPFAQAKEAVVTRFEREYLTDLLARHGHNLSEAARAAGLERKYLYRLLERAGLSRRG